MHQDTVLKWHNYTNKSLSLFALVLLPRSLEDQQGLSAFPQHSCIYEDLTQAQTKLSAQLVIEKKLREEIERLKQMNMPIQQECAQLQVQDIMESKVKCSTINCQGRALT